MDDLLISIFYEIDYFCKEFIPYMEQQFIQTGGNFIYMELPGNLALSWVMTIYVVFHLSGYSTFNWF
jgi:hypothetical protein